MAHDITQRPADRHHGTPPTGVWTKIKCEEDWVGWQVFMAGPLLQMMAVSP